ncbi:MAG: His/Gly/Thr/Pro-type tRNA ligase C-terminal domain-containing protein, partial [Gloeomargarita sp. GMQP_bins_5]
EQVAEEILGVLNLTEQILSDFGFRDYEVNLSTRPEKSVGSDEVWELATKALRNALDTKGWTYKEDVGGGAFYGPKIDIKIRDAIGRLWQCSTVQVDFNLPQRFGLEYVAADGSRQTPIMIHRAIFGSLERFFGILIEHYAGDFPLWLAPVQLRFLPVAEQYVAYAQNLATDWQKLGLRVEVDRSGERLGKLIRNAETAKIPVMAIVGAKEQQSSTLSIRTRHGGDLGALSIAEVQERLMQAVQQRRDF